jgi:hypothetical protein
MTILTDYWWNSESVATHSNDSSYFLDVLLLWQVMKVWITRIHPKRWFSFINDSAEYRYLPGKRRYDLSSNLRPLSGYDRPPPKIVVVL